MSQRRGGLDTLPFCQGFLVLTVPHDPTHPDDQTQGDIKAIACLELDIKASSKGNSKARIIKELN